ADVLRAVKAGSSRWVHKTFPALEAFAWQTGYGAFSVSCSQVPVVRKYIDNQEEHHRTRAFQDEFRQLLRRHGIEFTEEELWDCSRNVRRSFRGRAPRSRAPGFAALAPGSAAAAPGSSQRQEPFRILPEPLGGGRNKAPGGVRGTRGAGTPERAG